MKYLKKVIAEVLSRLLDPTWEIPAAIIMAVAFAMQEGLRWRFLGVLLFIDAIVPLIFFLTMLYHGQIRDWDIQKKSERIPLYLFTLLCHLGGIWMAHELGKTMLVQALSVVFISLLIFAAITYFWKVSLHAFSNSGIILAVNLLLGWQYLWLYILLLGVGWARVYQKHHTWQQVLAGVLLGSGMTWIGMNLV